MNLTSDKLQSSPIEDASQLDAYVAFTETTSLYISFGLLFAACILSIVACCTRETVSDIITGISYLTENLHSFTDITTEEEECQQQERLKRVLAKQIIIRTVVSKQPEKHITCKKSSSPNISQRDLEPLDLSSSIKSQTMTDYESISPLSHLKCQCEENERKPNKSNNKEDQTSDSFTSFENKKSSLFSSRVSVQLDDLSNKNASVCLICLNGYKVGETVASSFNIDCIHCYHKDCILEWLVRTNTTCPVCRREFLQRPVNNKCIKESV